MRTSIPTPSLPVRMLLHTDGSVTALLEACFDAPVVVEALANEVDDRLPAPIELELAPHHPVLWRQVVLHVDDRPVLRARSVLALDRLPPRARAALQAGSEPIGSVLRGIDTRRQLLASTAGDATSADQAELGLDAGERVYMRTYWILSGARPLAIVTERIPASIFDPLEP
jgi:chorismate-pyruvate lyase